MVRRSPVALVGPLSSESRVGPVPHVEESGMRRVWQNGREIQVVLSVEPKSQNAYVSEIHYCVLTDLPRHGQVEVSSLSVVDVRGNRANPAEEIRGPQARQEAVWWPIREERDDLAPATRIL